MKGPIKEHSEQLQDNLKGNPGYCRLAVNVLLDVKDHRVFVGTSMGWLDSKISSTQVWRPEKHPDGCLFEEWVFSGVQTFTRQERQKDGIAIA